MCLGIPARVVAVDHEDGVRMGRVDFDGVGKRICLEYVAEAAVGDYVLVHVGFAIARIDADEAQRIFVLLEEMQALDERVPGGAG